MVHSKPLTTKMFELLKPGCSGFLQASQLDSIPLKNYKASYEYILEVHEELLMRTMEDKPPKPQEHDHAYDHGQHTHGHTHGREQHPDQHHLHSHSDHDEEMADYDYFWPWDAADGDDSEFGGFSYVDYDFEDPEFMEEGGGRPPLEHRKDEL